MWRIKSSAVMLAAASFRSAPLTARTNPQVNATAMVPVRNHPIGCSLSGFIVLIGWNSSPIRRLRPRKNGCQRSEPSAGSQLYLLRSPSWKAPYRFFAYIGTMNPATGAPNSCSGRRFVEIREIRVSSSHTGRSGPSVRFGEQCHWMHDAQLYAFANRTVQNLQKATGIASSDNLGVGGLDVPQFPLEKVI